MIVKNLFTYLEEEGCGKPLLFIHGWGSSHLDFQGTAKLASANYRIINVDLWGFGSSEAPIEVWGSEEYADAVLEIVRKLELEDICIVGHSFGGKIASILCSKYPGLFTSLILVDSAGIVKKQSLFLKYRIKRYKKLKKLVECGKRNEKVLDKFGSSDYKNTNIYMRQIMVKVVNENLESVFEKIKVPTLIFWGKKDKDTPLCMGKKINKLIKGSKLIILNGGHFSHIDCFQKFNKLCFDFWRNL